MSLDLSEVHKIAHLARLAVSETEARDLTRDLSRILDLVAQMNGVDTTDVAPLAHSIDMAQRLRADTVTEPDRRERFQAIAPHTQDGLYLVPRVIE
jgi:aspartyl-tRNA(Asn)/glutamyl-tRNA(Gln) amidotransferase subunit C